MEKYLTASWFFDYNEAIIQNLVREFEQNGASDQEKAVACYLKIRDGWWYDPYHISAEPEDWKASVIASRKHGHCLDKSVLLVTCLRAMNIPARLQLAKVKNHIAVERLIETMGTNELTPHGMVNIYLDGQWLKASPAFNKELCEKCKVAPLDFDGKTDSVFQQYNAEGNEFMEYLEDYGHFDDLPLPFIFSNIKEHYPKMAAKYISS